MRTKIITITGLLLAIVLLTAFSGGARLQTASAQTPATPTPRTLNVTGNGKSYLTPDIAYINIGVHTENKNAAEAVASNTTNSKKVADALKKFNVDPKDIQTTNFSIYPQQQFDQSGKLSGILYVVDNTVFVTLRDISKVGDVIGAAVDAGANSINSIQFDAADHSAALSEARKAAVADALAQAKELASAAGVTLGDIQTINTYGGSVPTPVYDAKVAAGVGGGAPVPVSAGQLVVTMDVNIVFEIR